MNGRGRLRGRPPLEGVPDHAHGTNGYTNYGCRCDTCTALHSASLLRRRRERIEATAQHGLPPSVAHNRHAYTNHGCRCDVCRRDHNVEKQENRKASRAKTEVAS